MAKQTVAVDFDGVIHRYDGWKGPDHFNEPMPGVREFLVELAAREYRVVILSTRPAHLIEGWLKRHSMFDLVDLVTNEKITATAYVDDRAVRFRGEWGEALTFIETPPWWKQDADGKTD